ncbi:hypothetical protein ACOACO_16130 [Nocardioides sp. CPCC 205120]|uniref:hypothetical protein n=1 Tax=Nocardioides sp. CPCC 205120 TaxID=3406462 RepID=UPI003B50FC52
MGDGGDEVGGTAQLRAARRRRERAVEQLAARQAGLVSRRQLNDLGVHRDVVHRRVATGRWAARSGTVLSLTTGPLSVDQRRWLGLLNAQGPAALAGRTALEVHGLRGWAADEVTVVVAAPGHASVEGVRYFRSRRPFSDWVVRRQGWDVLDVEPAALLLAGALRDDRSATGLVAAVVQQRVSTAQALSAWLDERLPRLPRRRLLLAVLADVAGGSGSGAEVDLVRICREAGLAPPRRQTRRTDSSGAARYTDAEWDLADGMVLVLEVDGAFHMDYAAWRDDLRRTRRLSTPGRIIVRCTTAELRTEAHAVMADLRALGVPSMPRAA